MLHFGDAHPKCHLDSATPLKSAVTCAIAFKTCRPQLHHWHRVGVPDEMRHAACVKGFASTLRRASPLAFTTVVFCWGGSDVSRSPRARRPHPTSVGAPSRRAHRANAQR